MIKEENRKFKFREFVTRICDDCGQEDQKTFAEIRSSSSRKKLGNDYCKKCAYRHRILKTPSGPDSPYWKGGIIVSDCGYFRYASGVNKGQYVHKKLYEDHMGVRLKPKEQLHHIDMNKLNNRIDNMYLCRGISHHHKIHVQMEKVGFQLFNRQIWYNFDLNEYEINVSRTIHPLRSFFHLDLADEYKLSFALEKRTGNRYIYAYLGNKNHIAYHRLLIQTVIGRKLTCDEHIHHIDGNTENNKIENLALLSRSTHRNAHNTLQRSVSELYKNDIVKFKDGVYCAA